MSELTYCEDIELIRHTNNLVLKTPFTDKLGLSGGKMGVSILFYNLFRWKGKAIYEEFAGKLIDEITEEISISTPTSFENGLSGIGWGIYYLIKENFVEADADEILADFDDRIFSTLLNREFDRSLSLNGILGYGVYYYFRVINSLKPESIPNLTNKHMLIHVVDEIEMIFNENYPHIKESLLQNEGNSELWNCHFTILFLINIHKLKLIPSKTGELIKVMLNLLLESDVSCFNTNFKYTLAFIQQRVIDLNISELILPLDLNLTEISPLINEILVNKEQAQIFYLFEEFRLSVLKDGELNIDKGKTVDADDPNREISIEESIQFLIKNFIVNSIIVKA